MISERKCSSQGNHQSSQVRVPTHEEGQSIFWEFATDYYDLGFGVYFEWSKAQSNTVTVHVSDSSEEDEENEDSTNRKLFFIVTIGSFEPSSSSSSSRKERYRIR